MSKGRGRNPNIFLSSDGLSIVDQNGTAISGIAAYTWAQVDGGSIVATDFINTPIFVTDKNTLTGDGGVIITGSASGLWTQVSDTIYFSSFAALPAAATYKGWKVVIPLFGNFCELESRLVGADWLWRIVGNYHPACSIIADIPKTGTMTTQEILKQIVIPHNANTTKSSVAGQSLLQPGDSIRFAIAQQKTGAADFMNIKFLMGTAGTTSDTQIGSASAANGLETGNIAHTSQGITGRITLRSATSALLAGPASGIQWNGGSTGTALITSTTITNADLNDLYFSVTSQTRAGVGTDTALLIRTLDLDIFHTGG